MTDNAAGSSLKQLTEHSHLILRYKWQVLVASCALSLVFTIFIARLPNLYQATTTILVDPQQIPEKYVSPAISSDPNDRLSTITQQVLSRTKLQEIIDKLNLYPERRKTSAPEEIVAEMQQNITITVKQGSGRELSTFAITFQGRDRAIVASVANELAGTFIDWSVKSREDQVAGTKDFLSAELEDARRGLIEQENKLREYKTAHLGETPDQTMSNLQALAGLRSSLQANQDTMNRLEQEKLILTRLPETATSTIAPSANLSERARLQVEKRRLQSELRDLRSQYGELYPDVTKASRRLSEIETQLGSLPEEPKTSDGVTPAASATGVRLELIEKEMKRLKTEQARLEAQIGSYQRKVDVAPLREQELVEVSRNYETSKQHYQALLDKSFTVGMASNLEQKQKGERFTVLDPARTPEKPFKPQRKLLIPMSALVALGLSIGCLFVKELLSPSIKTETELQALLPKGLPIVGLIPSITIAADEQRSRRIAMVCALGCIVLVIGELGVIWVMRPVL